MLRTLSSYQALSYQLAVTVTFSIQQTCEISYVYIHITIKLMKLVSLKDIK